MQKYKIQSNQGELEDIGIDYKINGLIGTFVKSYSNGWFVLSVTHKVGGYEFTNDFNLPKYMCKAVTL